MTIADLKSRDLEEVCRVHRVKALYTFGSVVSGEMTSESDLDFIVQFERQGTAGAFDQFMNFKEQLEKLYERPVGLLTLKPFRNPVFREEVERTKTLIYTA